MSRERYGAWTDHTRPGERPTSSRPGLLLQPLDERLDLYAVVHVGDLLEQQGELLGRLGPPVGGDVDAREGEVQVRDALGAERVRLLEHGLGVRRLAGSHQGQAEVEGRVGRLP